MQYQSIIRIFEHCGIDCNALDVAKTRRILAAEFSIARNGVISIAGFDYTKNDVFKELERPDFAQRLTVHLLIWRMPVLLNCLEKNDMDIGRVNSRGWLRYDKYNRQVTNLVSPYFAVSFNNIMSKFVNQMRFKDADTWLKTLHLIDNIEDEDTALSSTRLCIADFIRTLKNLNEITYQDYTELFEKWFSQPWFRFVDKLPDSCYGLKNDLLSAMVNFTIVIQHKNSGLCLKMSKQMVKVRNIDPELRELIRSNHKIIRSRSTTNSNSTPWWLGLFIAITFIVQFIFSDSERSSSNSNSRNSSDKKYERVPVTKDFFMKQRQNYARFYKNYLRDTLDIYPGFMCYMLFAKKDTVLPLTVQIQNKIDYGLTFYVIDNGKLKPFTVKPSETIAIKSNTNALDILKSDRTILKDLNAIRSALIFDSVDNIIRRPKFGHIITSYTVDDVMNEQKADFCLEIIPRNYMVERFIFHGAMIQ